MVELSTIISIHLPDFETQTRRTPLNVNVNLLPGYVKKYDSSLEAKLALAKYLGKPLSLLTEKQRRFINALTEQTLEHDVLIAHLNDYMSLKLVTNKGK